MRSLAASAAAVSTALLLAACAGPALTGPASETSPAPTFPTASPETERVDILSTCRGYYEGGTQSIAQRVERWAPAVAHPATDDNAAELTTVRDRLGGQIRDAEPGPASFLKSVQKPFAAALDGRPADPQDVRDAAETVEQMCTESGYRP